MCSSCDRRCLRARIGAVVHAHQTQGAPRPPHALGHPLAPVTRQKGDLFVELSGKARQSIVKSG